MPLKYNKMWVLLEQNGYTTYKIRKEGLLGQATITAIKSGKGGIDYRTIEKLCKALNCQPGDLMEYISEE